MSNSDVRFIILDDHPLVCETLAANVREQIPESTIAYVGPDPDLAMSTVQGDEVWIAIVDADLGQTIDTAQVIRGLMGRGARVALVSAQDKPDRVQEAVLAGAQAFIPKREIGRSLLGAVTALRNHEFYRSSEFLSMLIPTPTSVVTLTETETRVLVMVAAGMSTGTVASRMGLSSADIDSTVDEIWRKYQEATALSTTQRTGE